MVDDPSSAARLAALAERAALDLAAASTRSAVAGPAPNATPTDDGELAADQVEKALAIARPEILPDPPVGIEDADLLLERCLGDLRARTASFGPRDATRVELGAEPKPSPTPGPQLPWIATVQTVGGRTTGVTWSSPADGVELRIGPQSWLVGDGDREFPLDAPLADAPISDAMDVRSALVLLRHGLEPGDQVLSLSTHSAGPESKITSTQAITLRLARADLTIHLDCSSKGAIVGLRAGSAVLRVETDGTWTELVDKDRTRWSHLDRPGRWALQVEWMATMDLKALATAASTLERKQGEAGRPCVAGPFAAIRRQGEALSLGTWCPIGVRAATPAELANPARATLGSIAQDAAAIAAFAARLPGEGMWRLQTWHLDPRGITVAAVPFSDAVTSGLTP